jgi:hypothetical protein
MSNTNPPPLDPTPEEILEDLRHLAEQQEVQSAPPPPLPGVEIPGAPPEYPESTPESPAIPPKRDTYSTVQFTLSLIAMIALLGIGALYALSGLFNMMNGAGAYQDQLATILMQAAGIAACGLMVYPSVYTSYRRMYNRPVTTKNKPLLGLHPLIPLISWILVLVLGYLIVKINLLPALFLPPIHVLSVILPVLFILTVATRGLPVGSAQRRSGVYAVGLVLGPFLSITIEMIAIVAVLVIALVFLISNPDVLGQLQNYLENITTFNSDELIRQLAPILAKPASIALILLFGSVIAPLTEELLKPIGVWFLARRNLSGAEGFTAGLLSGAGFAVLESITANTAGSTWLEIAIGRGGTAVIHILTTALTGWALALAWKKRRYLQLFLTFIGVVIFHGIWNAIALVSTINEVAVAGGVTLNSSLIPAIATAAPAILIVIVVGAFVTLLVVNHKLRRSVRRSLEN